MAPKGAKAKKYTRGKIVKGTKEKEHEKNTPPGKGDRWSKNKGGDRLKGKQNLELAVNSEKTCILKGMSSDKRRYGSLKIVETYDKNWKRSSRETVKKIKIQNFIVGVRATIEINGTEWGK